MQCGTIQYRTLHFHTGSFLQILLCDNNTTLLDSDLEMSDSLEVQMTVHFDHVVELTKAQIHMQLLVHLFLCWQPRVELT